MAAKMYETNSRYARYSVSLSGRCLPAFQLVKAPGTIGRWAAFVVVSRSDLEIDRVLAVACPRTTVSGA